MTPQSLKIPDRSLLPCVSTRLPWFPRRGGWTMKNFRKDRRSGAPVRAIGHFCRWKPILAWASAPLIVAIWLLLPLARATGWAQQRFHAPSGSAGREFAGPRAGMGYFGQHPQPFQPRMQQPRREHLPQWFRQHENMSPRAQQRALHREPGFNRLPPQEQRRLSNRLRQLDAMPPAQRQRTMQRVEAWERLTPQQRHQVRAAVQHVSQLPPPRQRMLHKAFRDLSRVPPAQRQAIMNSPQFRLQFSPDERHTLRTLMSIQPYTPPHPPPSAPPPVSTTRQ